MILYPKTSSGEPDMAQAFVLSESTLGSGGEGTVCDLASAPEAYMPTGDYVVKRFKVEEKLLEEDTTALVLPCLPEKLEALIEAGRDYERGEGEATVAFPTLALYTAEGILGGYLMHKAAGRPLREVCLRHELRKTGWTFRTLTGIGLQILRAIRSLHNHGLIVGDLSTSNILVDEEARVTLIDADSFQVGDRYRCRVLRTEYSSPKFIGRFEPGQIEPPMRLPMDDYYAAAVVLFSLFMGGSLPLESTGKYADDNLPKLEFPFHRYRHIDSRLRQNDIWQRIWHNFTPRMRYNFHETFSHPEKPYTSLDQWIEILEEYDKALRNNITPSGIYKQAIRFTDSKDYLDVRPYFKPRIWPSGENVRYGTCHIANGARVHPVPVREIEVSFEFHTDHIYYVEFKDGAYTSNGFMVSLRDHTDADGRLDVAAYISDMEEAGVFRKIREFLEKSHSKQPLLFAGGDAVRSLANYEELADALKSGHDIDLVVLSPRREAFLMLSTFARRDETFPMMHLNAGDISSWLRLRENRIEQRVNLWRYTGLGRIPLYEGFFRMSRSADSVSRRLEEHDAIIRELMDSRCPQFGAVRPHRLIVTGFPMRIFPDGQNAGQERILDADTMSHLRELFLDQIEIMGGESMGALQILMRNKAGDMDAWLKGRLLLPLIESVTEQYKPEETLVLNNNLAKTVRDQAFQFPFRPQNGHIIL